MQNKKQLRQIIIATNNDGKIREIKNFFSCLRDIEWISSGDFSSLPEVVEGDSSFFENSKEKARIISENTGKMAIADDSGLEVDALGGAPGVISSRYAGPNASDKDNRDKLLRELSVIKNPEKRTARFVCNMVFWDPVKGMVANSTGVCEGSIGFREKGSGGFGYDSIFIPSGYKKTMAEISSKEKNKISHRGKALKKMEPFLKNIIKY